MKKLVMKKKVMALVLCVSMLPLACPGSNDMGMMTKNVGAGIESTVTVTTQSEIRLATKNTTSTSTVNKKNTSTNKTNAKTTSSNTTKKKATTTKKTKTESYVYNGVSYKIIKVDGGDVSGSRKSNVAVDVGYGDRLYWGLTNSYGQLVYVIADKVILQDDSTEAVNSEGRYYDEEAAVPGTELENYDQGHVIADSLGGVANAYNITPQDSTLNRYGDQAYMEKVIRDAGGCTSFVATITYPDTKTQTPSSYKFTYVLKGKAITDEFPNASPESDTTGKTKTSGTTGTSGSSSTAGTSGTSSTAGTSGTSTAPATSSGASATPTPSTPAPAQTTPAPAPVADEATEVAKIDTNGNGQVTIAEAKAAGFTMPIKSDHWLYKYMDDRDGDGQVGE